MLRTDVVQRIQETRKRLIYSIFSHTGRLGVLETLFVTKINMCFLATSRCHKRVNNKKVLDIYISKTMKP